MKEEDGVTAAESVAALLESPAPERLATGYIVTQGPLWHPAGYYYFSEVRENRLYRIVPGRQPEIVRERTRGGTGLTFDLAGNLVVCEGLAHRLNRVDADGRPLAVLAEKYEGRRFNRPADVVCKSDGSLYFSDSGLRVPLDQRQIAASSVYRISPDGTVVRIADFECPNGLAFSPDERTLYVSNTIWSQYVDALTLDADGNVVDRRRFADMPSRGQTNGVPEGMKVDAEGRIFCTGPGGIWVLRPDGEQIGVIPMPEICANLAFGGPDLRTLFLTASRSVYTLRVRTPGLPHPWYSRR